MPRTKKVKTTVRERPEPNETQKARLQALLKKIDEEEIRVIEKLNAEMKEALVKLNIKYIMEMTNFPPNISSRTIKEFRSGELDMTLNLTKISNKTNQTVSSSRTLSKRSVSVGCEDEGYNTAESTRGTSSGNRTTRQSRSKAKTSAKPQSRSLSRNTGKKMEQYRTPLNKKALRDDIGAITPKCKPNTPQMLVRRPKLGEMAWSIEGSPLLTTHTIATETVPNINIPLPDGNLMSLLPAQGVRMSQIPDFEPDTRRQLEILRDNLIKVCGEYK